MVQAFISGAAFDAAVRNAAEGDWLFAVVFAAMSIATGWLAYREARQ